jgi:ABC-type Fe3+-siderophore transport system permease subunit
VPAATDVRVDAARPRPGARRTTRSRRLGGLLLLVGLVGATCLASIAVGTRSIGLGEVWRALLDSDLTSEQAVIVRQLRVPRTILGLMVGLALGTAGALMQGHTRNPLGDPGLLGVTAGASLAVVLAIAWLGVGTASGYVWFAFGGALAGTVLVYAIGSAGRGGPTPVTLALAGAALSALLYALVRAVLAGDQQTLDNFRFWVVDALAGRGADVAWQVAPFIAAGLVLALVNAPALNLLGLGEDVARGLG